MFYGMFTGKVTSPDFKVNHVIEDIEKLNRKATNPELDVTAVSVHACANIPGYTILRSGGSFGIGYGPIVTSTKQMRKIENKPGVRFGILFSSLCGKHLWKKKKRFVKRHKSCSLREATTIHRCPLSQRSLASAKVGFFIITRPRRISFMISLQISWREILFLL